MRKFFTNLTAVFLLVCTKAIASEVPFQVPVAHNQDYRISSTALVVNFAVATILIVTLGVLAIKRAAKKEDAATAAAIEKFNKGRKQET